MNFGQFLFPADDPGLVVTASQIRQSYFDPQMGPVADPNIPYGQPEIVVTGHSTPRPQWPLWIALAIMGYALFQGGKRYR